jgi:hypothetical protein
VIIKSHAVQAALSWQQTKQTGTGVSWLRVKRHRTEFGKAKAKVPQILAATPSLSNPAAKPRGLGNFSPQKRLLYCEHHSDNKLAAIGLEPSGLEGAHSYDPANLTAVKSVDATTLGLPSKQKTKSDEYQIDKYP